MGILYRNRSASLRWVRDTLGLTDGNLASHSARLEAAGYIVRRRALTPGGFQARLAITPAGDAAYRRYREALRALLEDPQPHPDGRSARAGSDFDGPRSGQSTRGADPAERGANSSETFKQTTPRVSNGPL